MRNIPIALPVALAALIASAPPVYAKKSKSKLGFATTSVQSKIVQYLLNPFGEVDGLVLENGTLAKTPPHMSGDVTALVKPGDDVRVQGAQESANSVKVYSITKLTSNQTLVRREPAWNERRMPKHLRALGLKEMAASGTIAHVIVGRRGEPQGAVLSDGTVVRVGGKEAYPLQGLFRVGGPLAARGYGSKNAYGRALEAIALGTSPGTLQPLFTGAR